MKPVLAAPLAAFVIGAAVAVTPLAAQAQGQPAEQAQVQTQEQSQVQSQDWSRWQVRGRVLGVVPDASGSNVFVQGVPSLSSPNSGLSIGNSVVPEIDISYFFTRNISAELILGVTPHTITGTGTLNNLNIASTWLLPPTLMAQYHFTDFGRFQPYFGLGLNYTFFFGSNPAYTPTNGLSVTSFGINNTVGGAAQIGFDYMIDSHWGINLDVKKLLLRPTYSAMVNNAIPVSGTANIDPWLFGGGITYRF